MDGANQKITTFLMFTGQAEEAMNFYISLFEQSEILHIQHHGASDAETEGKVFLATFSLNGQVFRCIDSLAKHEFTFTPSISLYVTCQSDAEIDHVYAELAQGGGVLMPLAAYPFSKRFGWVSDKFGVTWQLNLEQE